MISFLLQVTVLFTAIAAIVGIKKMALSAWLTFPLLAVLVVLAILGIVGATRFVRFDHRVSDQQNTDTE